MDQNSRRWWTVGIVAMAMAVFLLLSVRSYIADLEQNAAQLRAQLNEKSNQLTAKDQELAQKSAEITSNQQELNRRLEEVKKLQGSIKTVGRCLIGTMGAIDAMQKNDEVQGRQSLLLISSTCQESSDIIKQVEGFSTNSK